MPPPPRPTQQHQGAWGCYQLQFAIQRLRQQEAQSQQLLEQSRARHQVSPTRNIPENIESWAPSVLVSTQPAQALVAFKALHPVKSTQLLNGSPYRWPKPDPCQRHSACWPHQRRCVSKALGNPPHVLVRGTRQPNGVRSPTSVPRVNFNLLISVHFLYCPGGPPDPRANETLHFVPGSASDGT